METTKVFSDLLAAYTDPNIKIIALQGGTRSGKTWAILQLLDYIGRNSTRKRLISGVSETMPHLKRGAIRDFKNILEADEVYNPQLWHDTDKTYTYGKGVLEFFSADTPGKVHGPARDILWMNECNNMVFEVYRQLAIRTTEKIILDFNPTHRFWLNEKLEARDDVVILHSTYKDNDMLTESQIREIEVNKLLDPEWWEVYGEGRTGTRQGLVLRADRWATCDAMPSGLKKEWIVIDWGWSKPTAIMHMGLGERDAVYIDELAYKTQMDNPDIAKVIKDAGLAHLDVICDSAEPKSIKELQNMGLRARPTISKEIKLGIRIMNRYMKYYTKRSLGSIRENREYKYVKDKITDEYTDDPIDDWNHAKDAERYGFLTKLSNIRSGFDIKVSKRR